MRNKRIMGGLLTAAVLTTVGLTGCSTKAPEKQDTTSSTVNEPAAETQKDGSGQNAGGIKKTNSDQGKEFKGEEWYDQRAIYQVNREDAHTSFISFDTVEQARERKKENSTRYELLNGMWKFELADNPSNRNNEFYKADYDVSKWKEIAVPGNWQTQGYDAPKYTDTRLPWEGVETPELNIAPTMYNPVGSYRRTFTTPKDWDGKEIFVSFQGVESAFYLWVNGEKVGYSEDSYTASEFDISQYLNAPGEENSISVQVYRWSDGSYLEDQDFIRLSGIFRDVFLFCKDKEASIFDFNYTTDLDENYTNAQMNIEATIKNYGEEEAKQGYYIEATLFDKDGKHVFQQPMDVVFDGKVANVKAEVTVENPLKWSAEDPNLYQLVFELKDENKKSIETAGCNVGFREIEIIKNGTKESQIVINGKPIMFKGVNRHETNLETGRHITEESMIQDIVQMK